MFRVSCGYDTNGKQIVRQKTWTPDKNMTPKQIEKEVNRQAVIFEEECKIGYQSKAIKFEAFAEEWFAEYAKPNLRNTTYERLLQLRKRIYGSIGHLRMDKITPRQIQFFVKLEDGAVMPKLGMFRAGARVSHLIPEQYYQFKSGKILTCRNNGLWIEEPVEGQLAVYDE